MRRITTHSVPGPKNSLCYWTSYVSPWRVCFNFFIINICRFIPSLPLKNVLYRLVGIKIGRDLSVGLMVMFDSFFPHLISVGDNTVIGYHTTILAHEFLIREWATGEVVVGKDVMIGANSTILAGVAIGDGAVVSACSLVNCDVEPNSFVGGVPAKIIQVSDDSSFRSIPPVKSRKSRSK